MLLKRLMAALVTVAVLAAMAVPAFAQGPDLGFAANFLKQDQWCDQYLNQTQVQNGVTQSGLINVNSGNVTQNATQQGYNICAQIGSQTANAANDFLLFGPGGGPGSP